MTPRMSQAKLASLIGLTRASVVNIEAGRQKAPVHVIWDISEALRVEVQDLIPRKAELEDIEIPLHLTPDQVESIEQMANVDARTKRLLLDFVSSANKGKEPRQ